MNRTLRLKMKKGLAIIKETTEIPLKENSLLHTNEYTFYCNPTTFDSLVSIEIVKEDDPEEANKQLQEFFIRKATAANIQGICFDFDGAVDDLKSDLILGRTGKSGPYNEHWQKETNEMVLKHFRQNMLQNGQDDLMILTGPTNMYKAMVDVKQGSIEFIQFEEAMSILSMKNVMAEHVNVHRRPMYIVHKMISLIMYVRDLTKDRTWGE